MHYVGCETPRMLLLMQLIPHASINTWLVASTPYQEGLRVGGALSRTTPFVIAGDEFLVAEDTCIEFRQSPARSYC